MATKITEKKRKAFESEIAGSHKVEIKITVTENDEERAYEALDITNRDAVHRNIYFFDTPGLDMNKTGVVLRARAVEDDDHDSVVKIRPVNPDEVDAKWHDVNGFKIEADVVGEKVVVSASYKVKQNKDAIKKVARGKEPVSGLFSRKQKQFLAEFYHGELDLDDLTVLGPVKAQRADIERPGMAYKLTAEYWTMPDDSHLLEVSIKCPLDEAVVAREVFEAYLAGHGLDPHGAQATKTGLALTGLVGQLKQNPVEA
jgi:hypothetical protein